MKNLAAIAYLITALFTLTSTKAQFVSYHSPIKTGGQHSMIEISAGDVMTLKDITNVNIVYDYANMSVGEFQNEQDYLNKKMDDYAKKDPEKAEIFRDNWFSARQALFEPKFEALFNKSMAKIGMVGTNYSNTAPVTLKVTTF
jgi:hypothetical protein